MKRLLTLTASSATALIAVAVSSALAVGVGNNPVNINAQSRKTSETIAPSNHPMLVAEVQNLCGEKTALLSVETKDFWVNICGEEANLQFYIGVSKKDGKSIRLPVKGQNHGIYVAENRGVVIW